MAVLKDLSKLSNEAILAELKARGLSTGSSKEPSVKVIDYTPTKGKNAGKTVKRLQVNGNFFPPLLTQEACKVIVEHGGLELIKSFAKTGK